MIWRRLDGTKPSYHSSTFEGARMRSRFAIAAWLSAAVISPFPAACEDGKLDGAPTIDAVPPPVDASPPPADGQVVPDTTFDAPPLSTASIRVDFAAHGAATSALSVGSCISTYADGSTNLIKGPQQAAWRTFLANLGPL